MKKVLSVGAAIAVSGTLAYSAEAASHTVDTGDTIWGLAQENNTSAETIKSENNLTSDIIVPGQVIEIGGEEKAEEKTETAEEGLYTIKAGDTLFEIAQEFDVTVSDLKAWNNMSSDLIFAGKTLVVSGENAQQAPVVEAPQAEEPAQPAEQAAPAQPAEQAAPAQQEQSNNEAAAQEQAAAEQAAQEQAAAEQAAQEREAAQQQKQQEQQQQTKTENQSTSSSSNSGQNWGALAQCESGGNAGVVSSNGLYHGLYQFDVGTWKSVGGSGLPSQASAAEQTKRAEILFEQRGSQPWPVCGSRL